MIKSVKAHPRLIGSVVFGYILWLIIPVEIRYETRLLIAWDASVVVYLGLVALMMSQSNTHSIRKRAAQEDENRFAILLLTVATAIASLAAIVVQLANAKELKGLLRNEHIALAALTVFLSWTFVQTIFALHYAHEYYREKKGKIAEGLEFPGQLCTPDYWDFIYYSYVIGTACATADINITSSTMRKFTTIHCMISFFFNTTILALTINIGAGLFG